MDSRRGYDYNYDTKIAPFFSMLLLTQGIEKPKFVSIVLVTYNKIEFYQTIQLWKLNKSQKPKKTVQYMVFTLRFVCLNSMASKRSSNRFFLTFSFNHNYINIEYKL